MSNETVPGAFEALGGRMTQAEVSDFLGVTKGTLREWRRLRKGPAYIRASKAVFYLKRDVAAWFEAQRVQPDADHIK